VDVLRLLRDAQPAAYPFLVQPTSDDAFLGASPERLYRRVGRLLETEALAGTRPRGRNDEADAALAADLLASPKDRAEHDLVRAHLERRLGPLTESLDCAAEPEIYRLAGLLHLRTPVHARLNPGLGDGALLEALHPTPAVCGTPTEAARLLIREAEPFDRGLYAGPVGCFGRETSEVAVALRCALLRGHWVQLFAGAGIVQGSDAEAEWQETVDKMRTIEQALGATDAP
jgi:menaquinone-specific isochorismate synthase